MTKKKNQKTNGQEPQIPVFCSDSHCFEKRKSRTMKNKKPARIRAVNNKKTHHPKKADAQSKNTTTKASKNPPRKKPKEKRNTSPQKRLKENVSKKLSQTKPDPLPLPKKIEKSHESANSRPTKTEEFSGATNKQGGMKDDKSDIDGLLRELGLSKRELLEKLLK